MTVLDNGKQNIVNGSTNVGHIPADIPSLVSLLIDPCFEDKVEEEKFDMQRYDGDSSNADGASISHQEQSSDRRH